MAQWGMRGNGNSVQAHGVDPRDTRWECDEPAYRVHFWTLGHAPGAVPVVPPVWRECRRCDNDDKRIGGDAVR